MGLAGIGVAITRLKKSLVGRYDFSGYAEVTNAAAPGTLLHTTMAGYEARVTDIVVYNLAGVAAEITFYDEDKEVHLKFKMGASETANIELKASLVYGSKSIYARTDQAVNACITIAGKETAIGED